jgi:hypothetical protein
VEAPQVVIGLTSVGLLNLQAQETAIEDSLTLPFVEEIPDGISRFILLREITSCGSGTPNLSESA